MTYQTLSELVLLFMMALVNARVLFIKNPRQDSLSMIPIPIFLFALLSILANGVTIQELIVFILSFFVLLWNTRAILRLKENLIVDSYNILFILISIFNLILILLTAALFIIYRPLDANLRKREINKTLVSYQGSLKDGFSAVTKIDQIKDTFIYNYRGKSTENFKGTIFFIPNECADTLIYEPVLAQLAEDGYNVYSAEFYTSDIRWLGGIRDKKIFRTFFMCFYKTISPSRFYTAELNKKLNLEKSFTSLSSIVSPSENDNVYWVGEELTFPNIEEVPDSLKTRPKTIIDIASMTGYNTKGYGPIEETNPILALVLGHTPQNAKGICAKITKYIEEELR